MRRKGFFLVFFLLILSSCQSNKYSAQNSFVVVHLDQAAQTAFGAYSNKSPAEAIAALEVFASLLPQTTDIKILPVLISDKNLLNAYTRYAVTTHGRLARLYENSGLTTRSLEETKSAILFAKAESARLAGEGIKGTFFSNIRDKESLYGFLDAADSKRFP